VQTPPVAFRGSRDWAKPRGLAAKISLDHVVHGSDRCRPIARRSVTSDPSAGLRHDLVKTTMRDMNLEFEGRVRRFKVQTGNAGLPLQVGVRSVCHGSGPNNITACNALSIGSSTGTITCHPLVTAFAPLRALAL
jgi:hypothetical protein